MAHYEIGKPSPDDDLVIDQAGEILETLRHSQEVEGELSGIPVEVQLTVLADVIAEETDGDAYTVAAILRGAANLQKQDSNGGRMTIRSRDGASWIRAEHEPRRLAGDAARAAIVAVMRDTTSTADSLRQ